MAKIAPSILSADFSRLGEEVLDICRGGADLIHVDVMDGHFVPNITYGPVVMKSLNAITGIPYDVHLMIEHPERYLSDFMTGHTAYITVHQEAVPHLDRVLHQIRELGAKAGVALNPGTPVGVLEDVLDLTDLVLVMSVNPGFGGQKFIPRAIEKIRKLDEIRSREHLSFEIEVDGGVNRENAGTILAAGADILVAGSAVFREKDRGEAIRALR